MYFWQYWVFVAMRRASVVVALGGYSSLWWLLLLQSTGCRHAGFSSCGAWAQLPCGMWDLPRPVIKLVSPALTGGFSTTGPPGKSLKIKFLTWP